MTAAAAGTRPTVRDGHLLVDHLVDSGLPQPARRKVRADLGELTLSLTLADMNGFDAWRTELDTAGAVHAGPWRIGPVSAVVAIGRIRGVCTVLALEVEHDAPAPTAPQLDVGSPSAGVVPPASGASDALVVSSAAEQAGSRPAPDRAPHGSAPDAETTGDHDFRDWLGPDGRPRPWPLTAREEAS